MNCPKCKAAMEKIESHSITVDRCTDCKGIWFDQWQEKRLKQYDDADQIDIGDPNIGSKQDHQTNINCPVCNVPLMRIEDINQDDLWYESCPQCFGVYFDAGEFTRYKNFQPASLFTIIKNFFTGKHHDSTDQS